MAKKCKTRTGRICVTLPAIMIENYRKLAEETGLPVSKIIFLTLRRKSKGVILLPAVYTQSVNKLYELVASALAENKVSPELKLEISNLESWTRRAGVLLDSESGAEYYGKKL